MKKFLVILSVFFGFSNYVISQQDIIIPKGTIPLIDGIISTNEWDDAENKIINVNPFWDVQVFYKHSDSNLYFAFSNLKVNGFGERYPDILLDINNDKIIAWQNDDWWFHASYNDCEAQGNYNIWTTCIPDHPGWNANNFPLNLPGIVEIEISYSKIGLQSDLNDTIGISFIVSDTYNDYHFYPLNASIDNPSTWVNGVISQAPSLINKENNFYPNLIIYPNPVSESVNIKFINHKQINYNLNIITPDGKCIYKLNNISENEVVDCKNMAKGLYFFKLYSNNGDEYIKKIVLK
jgi:hypothetical protein